MALTISKSTFRSKKVLTLTSASLLVALTLAIAMIPSPRADNPAGLGFLELDGNVVPGSCVGTFCTSGTGTCASPISSSSTTDWACLFKQVSIFTGSTPPTAAQLAAAYISLGLPANAVASSFGPDGYNGGPLCPTATSGCPDPTTFTSGSKDVLDISANTCAASNNLLAKDDLINTYGIKYIDPATGHQIAYIGDEKESNGGDNNIGVWFDQETVGTTVSPCPGGNGTPFTGTHTPGDILTVSNFTKGGLLAGINAYSWTNAASCPAGTTGSPPLCLRFSGNVCSPSAPSTQLVCGIVSTSQICGFPWVTDSKELSPSMNNTLTSEHCTAVNSFYEMGIDLTALGFTSCRTNAIPETRSSQSLTATLFDFTILNLNSCETKTTTSASQNGMTVAPGTSVTDTATVTALSAGAGAPTGTVQFYTCGPFPSSPSFSTCDSSKLALDSSVTLSPATSSSSTATSTSFAPTQPGFYCFEAAYTPTGTGGFQPSASKDLTNECFVVVSAKISTSVSPTPIAFGSSATDTATVTLSLSTATVSGHVTFNVYGPFNTDPTGNTAVCTTSNLVTPFSPDTKTIGPATTPAQVTSDPFTGPAGYYAWVASYSPATGANGNATSTTCGDKGETLLIVKASITTSVSPTPIALGSSSSDTATVTLSPGGQTVAGTVTFNVYGPFSTDPTGNTAVCTTGNLVGSFSPNTVGIGPGLSPQSATSGSFTPVLPGYYAWIATYNPANPANGQTVSTTCGDTGETLLVISSAITTTVSPSTITFGQSATDTATVTLTPGGQTVAGSVTFNVYGPFNTDPTGNTAVCTTGNLVGSFSPNTVGIGPGLSPQSATSGSFTPSAPGFYAWVATYSPTGPANGPTATTTCGDKGETLQVLSIPKITAFNFTNTPTNNDPTTGSGVITYSVTIHNYGATAVTLSGSLTVSSPNGASVNCTGGNTLTLSGSLAAGADATFNLTCNYSGTSGQQVSATINAMFTDLNSVTGAVSGSPTTYTFTIQTQ